jgi:hypothetical protein
MCYERGIMKWIQVLLCGSALLAAGCNRLEPAECRQACLRYQELFVIDQELKKSGAAIDPARRARAGQVWAARQKELEKDPMLENCVSRCRRRGTQENLRCIAAAENFAAVARCNAIE